ncbi:hypothetical protein GCM10011506_00230 [Marivirga lumbricoides]|uniref:Calcineurin-like phosphoesterase domain-containing protein n=1 Tax=Marivirga lumbricoides TaxID=1046115 RepID=A0ABQ1L589_9BACT|nr:hypothetical protein GCM10011506_00230 [Marivirga lumbricoides]
MKPKVKYKKHTGPFDIIGDVHGCIEELTELLHKLEYSVEECPYDEKNFGFKVTHSRGRKLIFVGDLVNKGPDSLHVLKLAMSMVNQEIAFSVKGNHEVKLENMLNGESIKKGSSIEKTAKQLKKETRSFRTILVNFINGLPAHSVFDEGKLAVVHAGIKKKMLGKKSVIVEEFCINGEPKDDLDKTKVPVRFPWAKKYSGKAMVVYGHTPVAETDWINNTINIDTGCAYGGFLTALRYPEKELVSVKALKTYAEVPNVLQISRKNT